MEFEAKIIMFLQSGASEGWTAFFNAFSLIGSWVGFLIALLFLFFISKKYIFNFLVTYGLGVGFNYVLKSIIARKRPYLTYDSISALTEALGQGFPSGHAVSATIIAVFVCFMVFKLSKTKFTKIATAITMLIYVGIVCVSRMYLGVHYLTDVIAGVAVGGIVSLIGLKVFTRKPRKKGVS